MSIELIGVRQGMEGRLSMNVCVCARFFWETDMALILIGVVY